VIIFVYRAFAICPQKNGERPKDAVGVILNIGRIRMKYAVRTMMKIAKAMAENSTCQRLSVGCVITSEDNLILGCGFNGSPKGLPHCEDDCEEAVPGGCRCVHAEVNAILHSNADFRSSKKAYITVSPCLQCAKALVTFGVKTIYYGTEYRGFEETRDFLTLANVELCKYDISVI